VSIRDFTSLPALQPAGAKLEFGLTVNSKDLNADADDRFSEPKSGPEPTDGLSATELIVVDFNASALALILALFILSVTSTLRLNSLDLFWTNLAYDAAFPAAMVVALAIAGFYRLSRRARGSLEIRDTKDLIIAVGAGYALAVGFGITLHVLFGLRESNSTQLLMATAVALVTIPIGRIIVHVARRRVHTRVIIVGTGPLVDRMSTYLELTKGTRVVGHVVDAPVASPGSLGTIAELPRLCAEYGVNRLIISFPADYSADNVAVLRQLLPEISVGIVPRFFELHSWRSRMDNLYGLPLIEVAPAHLSRWDRFLKRGFDLSVGAVLSCVFIPVAAVLAVLVKLSSPGPVLFKQVRLGRNRQPFTIYKFRTMSLRDETESGPRDVAAQSNDNNDQTVPLHVLRQKYAEADRVTKLGLFLRKSGIDEIPQFFNVLKGDMSIVGPRPFTELESETLTGWEARRFDMRPGLTGLWQVSGRNDLSLEDLRRLDYLYVASWSMLWDIKIVWETPRAMIRGSGAY